MNFAQVTHTAHQADPANDTEQALRFAELAARSGLDPQLADRLADHPEAVLTEFGIPADQLDRLTPDRPTVVIEDLGAYDPRGVVLGSMPSYAS